MKFRNRKITKYLYVKQVDTKGLDYAGLRRQAMCEGAFDVSFHFVVHLNGDIEKGRDLDVIAGCDCSNAEESVNVFVAVDNKGKTTDAQRVPLNNLLQEIKEKYPNIQEKV